MNSRRRLHNAVEHMTELLIDDTTSSPRSPASKSNGESLVRGVARRKAFFFKDSQAMSPTRTDHACVYPSSQGERKLREWQDSFNTLATMEETSHSSLVDLLPLFTGQGDDALEVHQRHQGEHEESYQWSEASTLFKLQEAATGDLPQSICLQQQQQQQAPQLSAREGSLEGGVYSPDFLLDRSLAFDNVFNGM
jgi:hypothetical protein